MKSFVEIDISNDGNYLKLLKAVSNLSGLFSESKIPYINYRVAENIFCKSFDANNLSRSDTAFDANYKSNGIGLKTFTCNNNASVEKIAEFNSLSSTLNKLKGKELAQNIAQHRNERINMARRLYGINKSLYHIIARKENELLLYETDYETINLSNINSIRETNASLQFEDGIHLYSYNYSKSTLYRKFSIPNNAFRLPVEIIKDPYSVILDLFEEKKWHNSPKYNFKKGENSIILPLYGKQDNKKFVFESSGLNQWNAKGRKRNISEIYIPIPIEIHKKNPQFFPERETDFTLKIPTGEVFNAKVCQANSKALMTNPNNALSDWLLRKVLEIKEGELATMRKLDALGFDSVIITKRDNSNFEIDIMKTDSYENYINNK
jgi:hypothetical protein